MTHDSIAAGGVRGGTPPTAPLGWLGRWRALVASGAHDWRVEPRTLLAMWSIPALLVAGAGVAAALGKPAYKAYASEDGIVETLQVVAYAVALVYTVRLARRLAATGAPRLVVALYGALALGLVFMVGEELSWGQRLFGWGTPADLVEANKQAETNLHNIYGVGATFKWLQMVVAGYGAVLPFLVGSGRPLARYRSVTEWIVPHWALVVFFAPLFLWRAYRNVVPDPQRFYFVITEFNEVPELMFALGIALFVVYQWRRLPRGATGA